MFERVLEHEFDTKHYRVGVEDVEAEVREGLKILEQERTKYQNEENEEQQREMVEKQRVMDMQRKQMKGDI